MFFVTRTVIQSSQRFVSRTFATTTSKPGAYRPKTLSEAWLQDAGAYPVMAVAVVAMSLATGVVTYNLTNSPECRIAKSSRKAIFRGELKGVKMLDEA